MNSNNCELIRDLLPLYLDDVCSPVSREAVREHISECGECSELLRKMQDNGIENDLTNEKNNARRNQPKKLRRSGAVAGSVITAILMIPVLTCFIVNLATGHTLSWFFIVLASLLVFASLTVVPFAVPRNKFLWTCAGFASSLILLLATCCIYSGGKWFFVAAMSVLFGLAVVLLPFVAKCEPVNKAIKGQKGLFVLGADTVLFGLMLATIAVFSRDKSAVGTVAAAFLPIVVCMWAFYAIIRWLRVPGLVKAGICTALGGLFILTYEYITNLIIGLPIAFPKLALGSWGSIDVLDGNVKWLIFLAALVIGAIFTLFGFVFRKKEDK